MCVIIHKPAGVGFDEKDIRCAYDNNKDGFGFMYYDPELKKIIARKTTGLNADQILEVFTRLKKFDVVFHYRYKTVGSVIDSQCHPFRILNKKKHGVDMYFMHNGTVTNQASRQKGESDTQCFNRTVLKPILAKAPSLVRTGGFQHLIEDYVGAHSKLCFMYGDGKIVKFNEDAGYMMGECWVSNKYSFTNGYRSNKTSMTRNAYNNHGGGANTHYSAHKPDTPKITKDNTIIGQQAQSRYFLGTYVKVGDKLWVYCHDDDAFYKEGTITEFTTNCAIVKFDDDKGKSVSINIWLDDGACFSPDDLSEKYYAIPACEWDKDALSQTVKIAKNEASNVVDLDEKKHNNTQTATNATPTPSVQAQGDPDKSTTVTHGKTEIDSEERWGGAWVEDVDICDYSGTSIRDFDEMSAQERFTWFSNNIEESFNMLQDLSENIVIQDQEYEDDLDQYENYQNTQDRGALN